jgi:iron(III) transport system permease protein
MIRRPERLWLALLAAALLVIPWYGLEDVTSAVLGLRPQAMPALAQAVILGRWWLLPLLLAPLLVLSGIAQQQPRLLVAGGLAGIVWLALEGLAILHNGWGWAFLSVLGPAPTQPALGWGALFYALSSTMLLAIGLARLGRCRGDVFVAASIALTGLSILLFIGLPLLAVLASAVRDEAGHAAFLLFLHKLTDSSIWGFGCLRGGIACGSAWNSLATALLVGATSTGLGLAFALVAVRTRVRMRALLGLLSILPIITPPFVIGLALIILFGRAGMVTTFLATHFGVPRSRWLYGMPGIAIAQTLAFTPIAYLVMAGVLQAVSPSMEEAAQTLRAGPWRIFRTVTWPLIRPGIANAFLIGFIESMADFGNPLMLGGNFTVLSTDIFFAVVGATHDQGRAAVLAIVLLAFTLSAFLAQRFWQQGRSFTSVSGKGDAGLHPPLPRALRVLCAATVLPWIALTVTVYGSILAGGFVVDFGRDNTPTLKYFLTAFGVEHGVGGWFLSGSAWSSFLTTLYLALVAMPFTAGLGLLIAWLLARQEFAGKAAFEFGTMMSFAIPGTVIGIAYILAFNVPPLELTGTGIILVLAFIFRNMPVGIRAGLASLSQLDRSLDEASLTLGARSFRTVRLVVLPIIRPAIITAMVYAFVRAVTAVSAVIFLATAQYQLATVYIVGRADVGEYGMALVYSAALIVVMVAALGLIALLVGRQRIGRRGLAGNTMGAGVA